jgi:magnesium transporter
LSYLKQIDKTSHRIQSELQKSMKNKEIFQLLELEKSLVYFSTASKANQVVIEKIAKFEELKDMPEEMDLLNDLIIENKQAIEMCNIYREILTGTMDAFASIINNNVNIVMKLLTIITIIMSLPTLIASLWGMNVPVPFGGNPAGFWLVLAITLPLTVCFALLLINKTRKIK